MSKIIIYAAQSIDGFIADAEGSVNWLNNFNEENLVTDSDFGYGEFYDQVGITLMGNKTYQDLLGFNVPFPYPKTENYIFSRSKGNQNTEQVTFITEDPVSFTQRIRQTTEKSIWVIGGAQINTLFLQADLIDELIITTKSVLLGEGIPLFNGPFPMKKFRITSTQKMDELYYQTIMKKI